jgi:hypothetical protein
MNASSDPSLGFCLSACPAGTTATASGGCLTSNCAAYTDATNTTCSDCVAGYTLEGFVCSEPHPRPLPTSALLAPVAACLRMQVMGAARVHPTCRLLMPKPTRTRCVGDMTKPDFFTVACIGIPPMVVIHGNTMMYHLWLTMIHVLHPQGQSIRPPAASPPTPVVLISRYMSATHQRSATR